MYKYLYSRKYISQIYNILYLYYNSLVCIIYVATSIQSCLEGKYGPKGKKGQRCFTHLGVANKAKQTKKAK